MPELPEIETIRRSLKPRLLQRRVANVRVRRASLRRRVDPALAEKLSGRRIIRLRRRAKYLICDLDDGQIWIFHLGMSGRLLHFPPRSYCRPDKHDHVIVELDDASSLVFRDPRRFGLLAVGQPEEMAFLVQLGPEPLANRGFDPSYVRKLRSRTTRSVKDVLMDQRVVAGLGNIYANEALHIAGIRPGRRMPRLSHVECDSLVAATRQVLREAIAAGGSSISDFVDGTGRVGRYQLNRRVYDRSGEPCRACGVTIKRSDVGQRSSFYCPRCQR
jgi:formamidopyrimidine-DNA glycosylase